MTEVVVLEVTGMTCGHCASTVERAVRSLHGIAAAKVDLRAGKLMAQVDPSSTNPRAMIAAIEAVGYGAEERRE